MKTLPFLLMILAGCSIAKTPKAPYCYKVTDTANGKIKVELVKCDSCKAPQVGDTIRSLKMVKN